MRRARFDSCLLTAVSLAVAGAAAVAAQPRAPLLVRDFAPGTQLRGIEPNQLQEAAGSLYFAARDDANGLEPWTSDGTAAGTRRLADLRHGTLDSNPGDFTALGGAVVFHAFDSGGYQGVYRLDDEELAEIARYDTEIVAWDRLGEAIYFVTWEDLLYRSDGTRAGTAPIANLRDGASCPDFSACQPPATLAAFEGALYFHFAGQLYRLPEGGAPAPLLPFSQASAFIALAPGRLVFSGCTGGAATCGAYVTDGSAAGTRLLEPQEYSHLTAGAERFVPWRGRLYFGGAQGIASTDGTPAGTRLEAGFAGDTPNLLAATPGHLFYDSSGMGIGHALFAVSASGIHRNLGIIDAVFERVGTVGESLLFNHSESGSIGHPGHFFFAITNGEPEGTFDLLAQTAEPESVTAGGRLYFPLDGQLWRSDGSVAGTGPLPSEAPDPDSGKPIPFAFGAELAVQAFDPTTGAPSLWRVDPASFATTSADPRPLRVFAAGKSTLYLREDEFADAPLYGLRGGAAEELPVQGLVRQALAGDDHLFFLTDVAPGQMLWESDGTAAGTRRLLDFSTGTGCSPAGSYCGHGGVLVVAGDNVFFHADENGGGLAVWDRTRQEKRQLLAAFELAGGRLLPLPDGRVAFFKDQPAAARTLWTSDGSVEGTQPFFTLPPQSQLLEAAVAGDRIFFQLAGGGSSFTKTLWVSDLTAAGTRPLFTQSRFHPFGLVAAGRNAFFAADSEGGPELGFSDGTPAGTRVLDLIPGPAGSLPDRYFSTGDGRLVFAAAADEAGYELWISDGTRAGTFRLTDLNPGDAASSPANFALAGSRLFFKATDGLTGFELWALDLPSREPCHATSLCFQHERFEATAMAHAPDGEFSGRRQVAGESSGVFSFFSDDNWELMVKVLDGCRLNGHYWVFAAAATDTPFTLEVKDLKKGRAKTFASPPGPARAITDTAAFSCD